MICITGRWLTTDSASSGRSGICLDVIGGILKAAGGVRKAINPGLCASTEVSEQGVNALIHAAHAGDTHAGAFASTHTGTQACTQACTHTHTHAHAHTNSHVQTDSQTHTHTQSQVHMQVSFECRSRMDM